MVFVPAALKYLERLWGTVETIKFILVSIVASNIIAFGFNWIEFIATGNAELFLYGMPYHGQMSLQIALLVAFTQLIPEHQVQVMGVIKTRVKVSASVEIILRYRHIWQSLSEFAYGLPHTVDCSLHSWMAMPLDYNSIWVVCRLGVPAILQEEPWRVCRWHRLVWRREWNVFSCLVVSSFTAVGILYT